MFSYLTKVRSLRTREKGVIVGYGSLTWPSSENFGGDAGEPRPVYLVQLEDCEGSGYGRSTSAIFRVDQTEEVE